MVCMIIEQLKPGIQPFTNDYTRKYMFKKRLWLSGHPIFDRSIQWRHWLTGITNFKTVPINRDTNLKTMYALRNKVQLIGNLGNAPDIRTTESGKKWARFSMATNETYRNAKGEKVTETQWHTLVAWGKLAEIVEKYIGKGKEVAIEGKLVNRSYTDKDGVKKYVTEIQVNELLMLGTKAMEG
jgi:single-strand DNA-binding protein